MAAPWGKNVNFQNFTLDDQPYTAKRTQTGFQSVSCSKKSSSVARSTVKTTCWNYVHKDWQHFCQFHINVLTVLRVFTPGAGLLVHTPS